MHIIEKAHLVAENAHSNQTYGIYPYIYHPRCVYMITKDLGYSDEILVACILHDVLEDSDISYDDLKKAFGEEIAEIVFCVTDEAGRNRKEKKSKTYPKIRGNWKATVVKVCDRIANLEESIASNPQMLQMYKKEHQIFVESLYDKKHPKAMNKAWDRLYKLIDGI